jgi:hypothetical protein
MQHQMSGRLENNKMAKNMEGNGNDVISVSSQ